MEKKPINFTEAVAKKIRSKLVPLRFHPKVHWDPQTLKRMNEAARKSTLDRARQQFVQHKNLHDPDPTS